MTSATLAAQPLPPCPPGTMPLPPNYGGRPTCQAQTGAPPQGYSPQRPPQGYSPQSGAPPQSPPQGYSPQSGAPPQGYPPQSPPQGYAPQPSAPPPAAVVQPPPAPEVKPRSRDDSDDSPRPRASSDELFSLKGMAEALGVRVGQWQVDGSDADARTTGYMLLLDPDIHESNGALTSRVLMTAALGGSTHGFEGLLDSRSTTGARLLLGTGHGPFLRGGLGLTFLGNDKLYRSQIDIPTFDLGYLVDLDDFLLELSAQGGATAGGRFFAGDETRRRIQTQGHLGGEVVLHVSRFRARASVQRVFAMGSEPGTPIDRFEGNVCLEPVDLLLLCGHAARHRARMVLPGPGNAESDVTATYLGATLGLGLVRQL
ncbi:MAG: hypothetical protein R3B13_11920 [Polyangiaceae bacterium]